MTVIEILYWAETQIIVKFKEYNEYSRILTWVPILNPNFVILVWVYVFL